MIWLRHVPCCFISDQSEGVAADEVKNFSASRSVRKHRLSLPAISLHKEDHRNAASLLLSLIPNKVKSGLKQVKGDKTKSEKAVLRAVSEEGRRDNSNVRAQRDRAESHDGL